MEVTQYGIGALEALPVGIWFGDRDVLGGTTDMP